MGLDMNAYAVNKTEMVNADAETDIELNEDAITIEVAYWRKHGALHNWMKELYLAKGGEDEVFNTNTVILTMEDLAQLKIRVLEGSLEHRDGFFFGSDMSEESKVYDLEFISEAEEYIAEDYVVFYSSWW